MAEVTDDNRPDKSERKRLQVERAAAKSARARLIKLADTTANLQAPADSPPRDWSLQRRLDYVDFARRVVVGLRGSDAWLEQAIEAAMAEAVLRKA